jgi:7-cyano-7-deazaguanine synthase
MTSPSALPTIGVLMSGGLDSSVLVAELLRQAHRVQPFYVRSGLYWEREELAAVRAFLQAIAREGISQGHLAEPVVLDLPLADLYGSHWSVDGRDPPGAESPDRAVYLPGRNALLAIKPALWCGLHGIEQLALAVLAGNPFADATDEFFRRFEAVLQQATGKPLSIVRPFAGMTKGDVVRLGRDLPLELSFSCISPVDRLHCGRCNKCAERQRAFQATGINDPTVYANQTANARD